MNKNQKYLLDYETSVYKMKLSVVKKIKIKNPNKIMKIALKFVCSCTKKNLCFSYADSKLTIQLTSAVLQ